MAVVNHSLITELLEDSLNKGLNPRLTIISNSMSPLITQGDQVEIERVSFKALSPGDVVVLQADDHFLTHRYWGECVEEGVTFLHTKGDRPLHFDKPMPASAIVGRVLGRHRQKSYLTFSQGRGKRLNKTLMGISKWEIRLFALNSIKENKLFPPYALTFIFAGKKNIKIRNGIHRILHFVTKVWVKIKTNNLNFRG